jgi:lactoylglutathione lyase
MKTTLKSVLVYVKDVAATSAFYQLALGLTQTMATEDGRYVQLETGDVALAFAAEDAIAELGLPMTTAPGPAVQLAFETEDVEDAVRTFVEAGGTIVNPPTTLPWGQTIAHLRDLNGFIVEIGSIQSGEWDE